MKCLQHNDEVEHWAYVRFRYTARTDIIQISHRNKNQRVELRDYETARLIHFNMKPELSNSISN